MMGFIIGVFVLGICSIIYVTFPFSSYVKLFEILKHMYITKKIKKKYKNKINKSTDKP